MTLYTTDARLAYANFYPARLPAFLNSANPSTFQLRVSGAGLPYDDNSSLLYVYIICSISIPFSLSRFRSHSAMWPPVMLQF